ncbi:hypothetical protein LTR51_002177 [Lithohypha guttulata]|nr:hypothetical protein LTR51_002177 [Lithohypha guttulata]
MTLFGDLILGTILTLIADKVGRRKVLLGGSVMMIISGTTFALFESFWLLLPAAVVGVISITGGDFGPFRSIEESILSQLTTPSTRSDVLAWYVTISTLGSAIGSEMAGRAVQSLRAKDGWTEVDAYHTLFWIYAATGCVNLSLTLLLSDACEMSVENDQYAQVPQDENDQVEVPSSNRNPMQHSKSQDVPFTRLVRAPSTRSVMYKLWFLLIVDSLADGMVPFSLTNYYMDQKFHPSKATLGDITSASYFLGAFGATFAGPLARRIGLINTMVFTHVPSSTAVLLFPFPSVLWLTAGLVLLRTALNPMDQAPRTAFIAAVVKPEERTAVMGITSMLRTLASMAGPSVTGFLAANNQFWVAFVAAGIFRLAYDFGLYAMFVNMKVDQGTVKATIAHNDGASGRERDEEYELESPKFSLDSTSSTDSSIGEVRSGKVAERSSTG